MSFSANLLSSLLSSNSAHPVAKLVLELQNHSKVHGTHCKRVAALSLRFGIRLRLSESEINSLVLAAALHDVGKLVLDHEVLHAPRQLSQHEQEYVRTHPRLGVNIAINNKICATAIKDVILFHHERYDGLGYPTRIAGDKIPLHARIVAIIDTYDTITSNREYDKPRSVATALFEIERCAGTQFDPQLAPEFMTMMQDKLGIKKCNVY